MRIISILIIAGSFAFSISGCAKSGGSNPSNTGGSGSNLVKSYQVTITDSVLANTITQYTVTYTFDNSNRQATSSEIGTQTYKGVASNINDNFQFSYSQNTETETGTVQEDNLPASSATDVYTLNSSGAPDKLVSTSTSGTVSGVYTSLYQYDANGYCTELDFSDTLNNVAYASTKTLFTISGGNVVQEDYYSATGTLYGSISYTFGSTPNKTVLRFSTPPVFGHLNNDLVESSFTTIMGTPASLLNYSYTFDSQGRVSSATATTSSGKTYLKFYNIQYLN